jgi:multidrug resistance efflux pump
MTLFKKMSLLVFLVVCLLGLACWQLTVGVPASESQEAPELPAQGYPPASEQDPGGDSDSVTVRTIHPKRDPTFSISVEQPANVEAYYQADLMARLPGPVKSITHDIGDKVKAGEVLLQVDVPDLVEDVLQKEAFIAQRQNELELAKTSVKTAAAALEAARGVVQVKEADVLTADSNRTFRQNQLRRFQGMRTGPSPAVTQEFLEERTQYFEAAAAASLAARAGVTKANAEVSEAKAKLDAANADIRLKESLVEVARKERDKAKALLELATIKAPFDGVITRRNVDPGSFVQSAAAHANPLLTIARTDIVTVFMKVPHNYASFVDRDTEAVIQMSSLPGVVMRAKVTRFSPSLINPEHDRTMRVEVDLFNGDAKTFAALLVKEKAIGNADLKSHKLPSMPLLLGKLTGEQSFQLLPGQYGSMRLVLHNFKNSYVVPSSAVFSQGGISYVFLIKDGHVAKTPIEIRADNGKSVKIVLVESVSGQEIKRELAGNEEIVSSNQGELSDGQAVKTSLIKW